LFRGQAAEIEAKWALREGRDPSSALATAHAGLRDALRSRPPLTASYLEAARVDLVEAEWAARHHGGGDALAQARQHVARAIELNPQDANAQLVAAEIELRTAATQHVRAAIDRGLAFVARAVAIHPGLSRADEIRRQLEQLRTL